MNDPLIGKVLGERFAIEERIGEGSSSVIYRANQIGIDRPVALKVLAEHVAADESWVHRFHHSARAFARISHPSAVKVYDSGTTADGYHFIAMEFLDGDTLRPALASGPFPAARALQIMAPACRALGALHARGILHRDFKPESLHLGAGYSLKLLFSTIIKCNEPDSPKTKPGVGLGTPRYLSPEQVRGLALTPASDIYAAGVVLYEMLAGRPPFDGAHAVEVALMHLRHAPPPLPDVPGLAAAVAMRALAKDPGSRQSSAEELAAECESALAELQV